MNVISRKTLHDFWQKHGDAKGPLTCWYQEVSKSHWSDPSEIKARYATASFLDHNRVVFNIKGNTYRLVCSVAYRQRAVFIKFIGTHAEYDKLDASKVKS